MQTEEIIANPFALMLNPAEVFQAMERSHRLERLQRHSANGALARTVTADLRVHRAGINRGAIRGWHDDIRGRCGLRRRPVPVMPVGNVGTVRMAVVMMVVVPPVMAVAPVMIVPAVPVSSFPAGHFLREAAMDARISCTVRTTVFSIRSRPVCTIGSACI